MAYLGNVPARSFISFERQVFTIVNSQTAYTLSHSVTNENDIRLVVNNVVQEPGSGKAYTASGTTLTLSAALTNGTDEMYCVFLGRAVGTVNPPAGSVTATQLTADAVTSAKINYPLTTFSSTGIDDNATSTAVTIDSSENVGIGISPTPPTAYGGLHIHSTYPVMKLSSTATGSGTGDGFVARIDSTPRVELWNFENSDMVFATNNTERMRIRAGGGLAIGGTGDANTLDDYEEGTFTPTWSSNVAASVSSGNYGYYTKIGNVVTAHFGAILTCSTNSYYQVTNLPFQSNIASGSCIGAGQEYGHTGYMYRTQIGDNSTTVHIVSYQNNAVANAYLQLSLTYRTD